MALALRLAAKGRGETSPNPMVGAVIVGNKRILGRGYHRQAGGPHAEVIALRQAGRRARGATLYVTLEPCSHTKKRTPPCVPAILDSGLRQVVIAMPDPNPRVNGRGIRLLRRKGVRVEVGCLREDAERLNESYRHWVKTGRPLVWLKAALTLDGKLATSTGHSKWITGEAARRDVHRLRSRVDAIMVGVGTILRDNPQLTARRPHGRATEPATRQPLRIVLDSTLRVPLNAKVLRKLRRGSHRSPQQPKTLIATTSRAPKERLTKLRSLGVPVIVLPAEHGRVSLRACLRHLGRIGIINLMIEGGGSLNACALRTGLVDRVRLYMAPVLLGGEDAKSVIGGTSPLRLSQAQRLKDMQLRRVGHDFVIEGRVER